jgi:hypothetical protein
VERVQEDRMNLKQQVTILVVIAKKLDVLPKTLAKEDMHIKS